MSSAGEGQGLQQVEDIRDQHGAPVTRPNFPTVIGTRGSELALWQARHIQALLGGEAAGVGLQIIKTRGDQMLDVPLQHQLDKGFFTKELEAALLDGRVDIAVHSLKDLPTQMPPGLVLAAVPERADVNDVLFVRKDAYDPSRPLPVKAGARVGTASMRRKSLLQHVAPDVEATFLRGNVPTRLNKAKTGELDAVILARAGVSRLGLDTADLLVFDLDPLLWLPAAAQGALGIQCRGGDAKTLKILEKIANPDAALEVALERELLQRMEGGCHSPFGALATVTGSRAVLRAGTVDARDRWVAVQVEGTTAEVAAQAETALRAAIAKEQVWVRPAARWA